MIFLGKELCCISFLCKNTIFMFPTCKKLNISAFFSFFAIRILDTLGNIVGVGGLSDPEFSLHSNHIAVLDFIMFFFFFFFF